MQEQHIISITLIQNPVCSLKREQNVKYRIDTFNRGNIDYHKIAETYAAIAAKQYYLKKDYRNAWDILKSINNPDNTVKCLQLAIISNDNREFNYYENYIESDNRCLALQILMSMHEWLLKQKDKGDEGLINIKINLSQYYRNISRIYPHEIPDYAVEIINLTHARLLKQWGGEFKKIFEEYFY